MRDADDRDAGACGVAVFVAGSGTELSALDARSGGVVRDFALGDDFRGP